MSDIKEKLEKLRAQKILLTGKEWRDQITEEERLCREGAFEIDKIVPGKVVHEGLSPFYLVQSKIPLGEYHGVTPLSEIFNVMPEHLALITCVPQLEEWNPSKVVFLDVETTGLAGGTGTVAFLVGLGFVEGEDFCVVQCFMRDYHEEPGMLEFVGELLTRFEVLVSYNGKSFDVPLLRNRFIQNRLKNAVTCLLHLDLLHAARRFWRTRLIDCSLGNIEREILGIVRRGDIPSEEIPQIWLDYVRSRDARRLDRVFYHHRMDIVTLVVLTAELSRNLQRAQTEGLEYPADQLSLVRLLFRQHQYEQMLELAEKLLEGEIKDSSVRCVCMELMGFALKRLGKWEEMEKIWRMLLQEAPNHLVAYLELAKFYEHRAKDLAEAERLCVTACQWLETRVSLYDDPLATYYLEAFRFRLDRIQRKKTRWEEPLFNKEGEMW